jgi:hypothetical protein
LLLLLMPSESNDSIRSNVGMRYDFSRSLAAIHVAHKAVGLSQRESAMLCCCGEGEGGVLVDLFHVLVQSLDLVRPVRAQSSLRSDMQSNEHQTL